MLVSRCTARHMHHAPSSPRYPARLAAVVDGEIKKVSLSEYLKKGKYVVLFFYPKVRSKSAT